MNEQSGEIKLHALDYWQVVRNRYGVILLAFFLVFMTAGVITYILPRQFVGKVRLEINKATQDWEVFQSGTRSPGQEIPGIAFVQTQFEIISSKETLYRVIDQLDLMKRWSLSSKNSAYSQLYGKLNAQEVRGTDLIDIIIYHTDPVEAAELANAVADSYQERRREQELSRSTRALASLEQQLNKQRERVEESRMTMLDIMRKYRIIDLGAGLRYYDEDPVTGTEDVLRRSIMDRYVSEQDVEGIKTQIEALTSLQGEELIAQAAALNVEDNTVAQYWITYQEYTLERHRLADSGLGGKHPRMVQVDGQIRNTWDILMRGVESIKSSLQTQLDIALKTFNQLEGLHRDKEDESMEQRMRNVEYSEANKEYEMQKDMLKEMQSTLYAESIDITMPKTPIIIHEYAEADYNPAKPNATLNLMLGAVVGLAFGVGLAFFLEYLDTSVKSLEDVERYLQVPVLAVIPKDVGVLHKQNGLSPDAEAYRILRTNIEFNRKSADANSITVVSGGAGEGKSTTLVNLAYICAQGGYNTLMIDGDLRRPKLHTFFDINNSVGLTNYLTTELMLEDVILQTPIDNLYFMPSGILPADAAGILNSRRMSELIADVKSRFDLVLIDSPPILGVSDASVLASEVDLTMVVIQHRKLPRSMLIRVKQAIENVGGNLLGVVLNNVDIRSDNQYQYYTSYYTYYSPTSSSPAAKPTPPVPAAPQTAPPPQSPAGGSRDEY